MVPSDFEVETNDASGLVLAGAGKGGVVKFELGREEQGSVNIVDAGHNSVVESNDDVARSESRAFGRAALLDVHDAHGCIRKQVEFADFTAR